MSQAEDHPPPGESDLAQQLSKSPYLLEWLGLGEKATEAQLERGLRCYVAIELKLAQDQADGGVPLYVRRGTVSRRLRRKDGVPAAP